MGRRVPHTEERFEWRERNARKMCEREREEREENKKKRG
jgi:hypothetical protein